MSAETVSPLGESNERGWHRPEQRDRFCDLYREQKPRLTRYFQLKLGNGADADEMAQETLARFFRSAPAHTLAPTGYLVRIAQNLIKDRACRNSTLVEQRSVPLQDDFLEVASIDPHREAESRERLAHWHKILHHLPAQTLKIFILNRVDDFSYREVAEQLELPLWQVQKHMLRAIRHVKRKREERDE